MSNHVYEVTIIKWAEEDDKDGSAIVSWRQTFLVKDEEGFLKALEALIDKPSLAKKLELLEIFAGHMRQLVKTLTIHTNDRGGAYNISTKIPTIY